MNQDPRPSAEELAAWLRLTLEPGLTPAQARALLAAIGLPQNIFDASISMLGKQLPTPLAVRLSEPATPEVQQRIEAALQWLQAPGHHLLTLADPAYPAALLTLYDPPPLLYVNGQLDCLRRPALAIVGARNATPGGRDNAQSFARHLARSGWCIVSGLALGIDAAAHEGALQAGEQGGGTIAVMGTGADIVYPAANLQLAHRIAERGAILTEFPLGTPSRPNHFPRRNRIVAGLAQGVLVVEAAQHSGSLITARLAGETGREVFAIPGSIHSPLSRGCHALIRNGAKLVESAQDIEEEMGGAAGVVRREGATTADATTADNTAAEHPILAALGHDPVSLDSLHARTGLPTAQLLAQLLELELAGRVARLPGGLYQRRGLA
jgi:DNA processing protein